jgi:uncharacterized protein (TIGR03118 family)
MKSGVPAVIAAASLPVALAVPAVPAVAAAAPDKFRQVNLVSDRTDQHAKLIDRNLKNPWGLAPNPSGPMWVANNVSNTATIYSIGPGGTSVSNLGLVVAVAGGRKSTGDGPSPTGQVFNPTSGFMVATKMGSGPALFIFSQQSGQISGWSPNANGASSVVEFSSRTAVYKGLAIAAAKGGTFLYATNFHDRTVDVFNSHYKLVRLAGNFRDPKLPAGYAPFGVKLLHGQLYVSYALANKTKHDDVGGAGHGFVDVYTVNGVLVKRLVSRGALNSPWGLAIAPAGWGPFGGDLLVGNLEDGRIHAYDAKTGALRGTLRYANGKPVVIPGLWDLVFGTSTDGGSRTLLFSAGIHGGSDGLFGSLSPA